MSEMRKLAAEIRSEGIASDHVDDARILRILARAAERAARSASESGAVQLQERDRFELQPRVKPWLLACFGGEIANDRAERAHRFIEEALELTQAVGTPREEAHQLVEYVYDRPAGSMEQEVGGVMLTLAALCLAYGVDMHEAGEKELVRVWGKVDAIRAKQAAKPHGSALPQYVAPKTVSREKVQALVEAVAQMTSEVRRVSAPAGADALLLSGSLEDVDAALEAVRAELEDRTDV